MSYDAIIIGAGMSALAAGIRLAHYGQKVCLLERHFAAGGLNSYYRRGGYDLDVGLHAMTNFVAPETRQLTPFLKILRQLRVKYEDFGLFPQAGSQINFKGASLNFTNDFEYFKTEIHGAFPAEKDNFEKLLFHIQSYNELDLNAKPLSAREIVSGFIKDPLLVEMLFCPLSYYGSAIENDMEFGQFVIMFKSIFLEGFSRPYEGVRRIISLLERRLAESGGELRLKTGVRSINVKGGRAVSVTLDSGEELSAAKILSSMGLPETLDICSDTAESSGRSKASKPGKLSFTEVILLLDKPPADLGHKHTIIFYNDSEKFNYRMPHDIVDYSSGVLCCPNNFKYEKPLADNMLRVTNMANHDIWESLERDEYRKAKDDVLIKTIDTVKKYIPGFEEDMIKFYDIFTPKTVKRFTGHINGAVYGAENKSKNGTTHIENLFICGTDQGFLGIIGAILSGISIANLHFLMKN